MSKPKFGSREMDRHGVAAHEIYHACAAKKLGQKVKSITILGDRTGCTEVKEIPDTFESMVVFAIGYRGEAFWMYHTYAITENINMARALEHCKKFASSDMAMMAQIGKRIGRQVTEAEREADRLVRRFRNKVERYVPKVAKDGHMRLWDL